MRIIGTIFEWENLPVGDAISWGQFQLNSEVCVKCYSQY